MRALFRILIIATGVGIFLYYTTVEEPNVPLEGPNTPQPAIPTEDVYINDYQEVFPDPQQGLSLLIGQSSKKVLAQYGEPSRRDIGSYGNEWWIYDMGKVMISIDNNKVNEVYTNAENSDISPYKIAQSIEDVYRITSFNSEVSVTLGENVYIFEMGEQDMRQRLLVQFDSVYAQLYLDEERGVLAGIRFLDGKTLVIHQPYGMQYMGELLERKPLSSSNQLALNKMSALQLSTLVNKFRRQYGLAELGRLETLDALAMAHSEDMFLKQYMSHESPTSGSLEKRLQAEGIEYKQANENIAMAYFDAIEAVHGLLNSTEHRKHMLSEDYTHMGTGVYYDYYTQIFIEQQQTVESK